MRIGIFLLLLTIFHLQAENTYSQITALSLSLENKTIEQVLDQIEKDTEFSFLILDKSLDINKRVSINVIDVKIDKALEHLFRNTNIQYRIMDRQIVLLHNQMPSTPASLQQKEGQIIGTIKDENGESVIGASIQVKGTSDGTITDLNGSFSIETGASSTLVVSYIGYTTQEIQVGGRNHIDIILREDTQLLEEVIVVGYGTLTRKELTSAISHISSKDFLSVSSIDPSMMIQGKVSGVSITNTGTGDPNNQASIQIRGISSRSAGTGPLIVIDGVPGGNLTNMNANDIESIDVLKDGAASAIYGTRGSNGVVLVTTKKGNKDGRIHTSYAGTVAIDQMKDELDPLNAQQYREYRVPKNQGLDMGGDTDWIDEISRTGFLHQHTLTLSGGNAKSNYRGSMDFRDAKGIDLRSSRKEYGARFTFTHTTASDLLSFTANLAPRIAYRNNSDWNIFKAAVEANPTTPVMDPNNPLLYSDFTGQAADFNPVELLKLEESGGDTKLLDWDATIKLNLLPVLAKEGYSIHSLSTQVTLAEQQNDNFDFWFRPSTSTLCRNNGRTGEASRTYSKSRQQSLEWLGNYAMETKGHRIRAMVGYSHQYFLNQGMWAENKDFPSDILTYNKLQEGEWAKEEGRNAMSSYKNDARLIAFFGRINYDYLERYLLTFSFRREGSSKFGKNNKWGNFPAASVGWRMNEEAFMKNVSWINDLKLRADIGITGNQDFGSYNALSTMQGFGSYYYNGNYFTVWGPARNTNYDLKWEKAINWNIGLDFSLFNSRAGGSLNYYNRRQQDLLGDYRVPSPPYIFNSTFVNVGTMRNTGIELDLTVKAVQTKDFSYTINFAGASNNNKFLNFSNSEYVGQDNYDVAELESPNNPGPLQRVVAGERLGNYFTWAYAGVDENGDWLVWNKDNTEKISIHDATQEDKRVTGNGLPKFTASLTNTFVYKNWDLTVYLRGAFGFDLYNVQDLYYGLQTGPANILKKAYDKNAAITTGNNVLTDYFMEKGNYVKLDVVTLGYRFNIDGKWLNSLRLYATGRNLATFTGYSGIDPATFQVNGLTPGVNMYDGQARRRYYPTSTQLSLGIQLDF
ncbi:MAG: SusC/RagA family TonB-linked outer membrane protein [Tannerellaceae bacterium]|nr:SusC/RagA family TonB-linked outer membrane protein [Tannerellaceae bacterium]